MELHSILIEALAFNTEAKFEGNMLIVMEKPTHEEKVFQPLYKLTTKDLKSLSPS